MKGGATFCPKKILLFEFYLLPLLTFLHTSRFVRYDLEYAFLIHKCLTLYANNYMQAQKWLQCTLTLTTLMYNFAMTGFFTWFDSTPPCGQNCIFLKGSAYWRVLVPPPRPIVNIYVLPSKLSGSKKNRFFWPRQLAQLRDDGVFFPWFGSMPYGHNWAVHIGVF